MSALNNMKIGTKLIGSFFVVIAMLIGLGGFGLWELNAIYQNTEMIGSNVVPSVIDIGEINTLTTDYRGQQFEHSTTESDSEMTAVETVLTEDERRIKDLLTNYQKQHAYNAEELAMVEKITDTWNTYLQKSSGFLALSRVNKNTEAIAILNSEATETAYSELSKQMDNWADWNQKLSDRILADSKNSFENGRNLMMIVMIVAALFALGIALVLSQSITGPLQKGVVMMQELTLGHLGSRLNLDRKDEIGVLARAMDNFSDDLQSIVASLQKVAAGDLNVTVVAKDSRDEINPALEKTISTLRLLVDEINRMSRDQNAGDLDAKINAELFTGVYRDVAQGIVAQVFEHIRVKRQIVDVVSHYAQGDFAPQMEKLPGKKAYITTAIDKVRDTLRSMLTSISEASANLTSATAEILAATTQQASGASEQSAAISQTTTTVEEVKASAEQAAMRAQDVATASQRTVEVARSGQGSVQATIESMAMIKERVEGISENLLALSDQTQQIGEIISTVNEIASQSNMLALNASVEAARAGEHGKGFAVVATEVRSLAEQSRQATEQIKAILSEIQKATNSTVMATEEGVKGVDRGVQLSMQSRESIEQLSAVINESAQVAAQVVASGQQQQTGIDQIALAMQNINQVTMQSLASTRQTEKSAQSLNELARRMSELLAQYRF